MQTCRPLKQYFEHAVIPRRVPYNKTSFVGNRAGRQATTRGNIRYISSATAVVQYTILIIFATMRCAIPGKHCHNICYMLFRLSSSPAAVGGDSEGGIPAAGPPKKTVMDWARGSSWRAFFTARSPSSPTFPSPSPRASANRVLKASISCSPISPCPTHQRPIQGLLLIVNLPEQGGPRCRC